MVACEAAEMMNCLASLIQPAHETFDSQLVNSRQHSELVGEDCMPVTRGYTVAKYPVPHSPAKPRPPPICAAALPRSDLSY